MDECKEVCIVYYKDAEEWASYVKNELEGLEMKIFTIDFEQERDEPTSDSRQRIQTAPMTVVILSPQLMDLLATGYTFDSLIPNPSNCVILLLGEPRERFDEMQLSNSFPKFHEEKWIFMEYTDGNWKALEMKISELYETAIFQEPERKPKRKKNSLTLYPDKVRCEEKTEMLMCFKEAVTHESLEVFLESQTDHSEIVHIKEVIRLNPFTFKFKVQGHAPGKMHIKAMYKEAARDSKKRETVKMQCEASAKFEYVSTMGAVDGLNHILLYVTDAALTMMHANRMLEEMKLLDRKICSGLFNYDQTKISTAGFELLFGQYEFCETESSTEEIPTLLHLAAKFGLKDLVGKLTDLPGGALANSITNSGSNHPADLASMWGHTDVKEALERFAEEDSQVYGKYVEMAGYKNAAHAPGFIKHYYNQIAHTGRQEIEPIEYIDKDDYMLMLGNNPAKPIPRSHSESDTAAANGSDEDFYTTASEEPPKTKPSFKRLHKLPEGSTVPQYGLKLTRRVSSPQLRRKASNDMEESDYIYEGSAATLPPRVAPPAVTPPTSPVDKGDLTTAIAHVQRNKKKVAGFFNIFKGNSSKPQTTADSKTFTRNPNTPEIENEQRNSTASNSSGGSRDSLGDEPPPAPARRNRGDLDRNKRKSRMEMSQQKQSGPPPVVPPRLPPRQQKVPPKPKPREPRNK